MRRGIFNHFLATFVLALVSGLIVFSGSKVFAYDIDSHFYMTAAGLIQRGIKKEVAFKMAAYAQWIDESEITTPMQTERKRRIFHFPMPLTLREIPRPSAEEVSQILTRINGFKTKVEFEGETSLSQIVAYSDRVHGKDLGVLAEVKENNPMAYDILKKGLATGDYVLVGAGLHILMDSFGHYGFSAAVGHASAGHDPDAPYKHQERYYRMIKTFFDVTTILLHAMPAEAKEMTATLPRKNGDWVRLVDASSDEVFQHFIAQPEVKKAIEEDIQRSEDYTKVAVSTILTSLYQAGALVDLKPILEWVSDPAFFQHSKSTEEIMTEIIAKVIELDPSKRDRVIHLPTLQDRYLRAISMHLTIPQFVAAHGGVQGAAAKIANLITYQFIAHNITSSQQFVVDPEGLPREVEMKLRIRNWQNVIESLVHEKVMFDKGKSFKDFVASAFKERFSRKQKSLGSTDFRPLPSAELSILEKGIEGVKVGVNYREQWAWNWRMFNIVYIDFLRYIEWRWRFKLVDFKAAKGLDKWTYLTSVLGWNMLESLPGSHDVIDPEVYFIQNESEFKKALEDGVFKKIISRREVKKLERQYAEKKRQALSETIYVCQNILGQLSRYNGVR